MISERTRSLPRPAQANTIPTTNRSWHRVGLGLVVLLAAVLNFYGLAREGYGNLYYAAAVRSMAENWHAFFFSSLDPAGFVSIDKPPLGFWLQVASVKVFGYSGVALMLPQALAGVLSVIVLYSLVARYFGPAAGLLAALVLAVTPISVVANRNNIVESTLVLTLLLAAWAVMRAVETGKLRWLVLCAVLVGLGFNIKMLQAYLVLPAFGLTYLVGARIGWPRRLARLVMAGLVLLLVSLAWVGAVDRTPASQRPWVGSTTTNNELDLAIGYNGLQRLTGNVSFGVRHGQAAVIFPPARVPRGAPGGAGENGSIGPLRLLSTQLGGQISWLLSLAILGFLLAAWQTRAWPPSPQQSSLLMWGMWLLTTGVFFSIAGFYHTYYLTTMAPPIAALAAIGLVTLWRMYRESAGWTRAFLPVGLLLTAVVEARILGDYPAWSRWLTPLVVGLTVAVALVLAVLRLRPRLDAHLTLPVVLVGVAGLLLAPGVWSAESANAAISSSLPRAGPVGATGMRAFGASAPAPVAGAPPAGAFAPPGGRSGPPSGKPPAFGGVRPRFTEGPGTQGVVNRALLRYLERHQGWATYLFGTPTVETAEAYIIATGKPVMAMGGFTGTDPILTPGKLAGLVRRRSVRYFLLGEDARFAAPGFRDPTVRWIQTSCKFILPSRYSSGPSLAGTLYDCRPGATRHTSGGR